MYCVRGKNPQKPLQRGAARAVQQGAKAIDKLGVKNRTIVFLVRTVTINYHYNKTLGGRHLHTITYTMPISVLQPIQFPCARDPGPSL